MALKKEGKKPTIDEAMSSEKYVRWLSELNKESGPTVGGKGANLAEMYNAGLPVPPAFCVTAQSFDSFLILAGLKDKIIELIKKTNVFNTKELDENSAKIREMVATADMPMDMQKEITEAYDLLSAEKAINIDKKSGNNKEAAFVAVRSSATTEDLAGASFAGQQETFTNVKGKEQLIIAVKKCFASLYTARAVYYRHKKGFDKSNALLSVVVQRMVNSEKSGVMFTKNPMNQKDQIVIEAVYGLGEGIVSGKIRPDHYVLDNELEIIEKEISNKKTELIKEENGNGIEVKLSPERAKSQVLTNPEIKTLGGLAQKIENHYKKPQDIEFALEGGKIFIVQSRPITTLTHENLKKQNENLSGKVILSGLAASPGVASGIVKIVKDMKDLDKIKKGDVLVTKMTNPDMVVTMQKSVAVVTDEGGATAHAAIVSREMGIPCVVGTDNATEILKDGQLITIDGTNGKVYDGKAQVAGIESGKKEVMPIVKGTRTKIKVMVDLPHFAARAAKSESDYVGLMRLEGIIAESGKHPMYFIKNKNAHEYSKIIEHGIAKIAEHFKSIWIRTSDIRSDEYEHLAGAPKEKEVNPMLGFHGIRFSLKNLPLMEAELSAVMRVAEKYPDKHFGIMFPQIISEEEMAEAYKVFKNYQRKNIVIGTMIETPAAVQVIRGICKYAKFISFGTNDLTQFTLAIDRGNTNCQYLYNEMHPAILSQLKRVIEICKEYKVETSICGQAGSKKEMVEFLVRHGIDSLSVNADMAHEISVFVKELEENLKKSKNYGNTNMSKKAKILPIDNMKHLEKKGEEAKEEILKKKIEKENENRDTIEVTTEDLRNKDEKKSEEFPDFEIGFDPFQDQTKK